MTRRDRIETVEAAPALWRPLGHVLGDAFQDDPVWRWIAPNSSKRERHLGEMFAYTIRPRVKAGLAYTTTDLGGGAIWAAPDRWKMKPIASIGTSIASLQTIGLTHLKKAMSALSMIESIHPREPHWYLEFLASHVDRRGQGYGSALISPMLDRCDSQGMPAYLESSKEENLPFYNRFGFKVTREFEIGPGGPKMWAMWRDPQ